MGSKLVATAGENEYSLKGTKWKNRDCITYETAILEEYLSKCNIYHHQLKQQSLKLQKSIKHASCDVF